MKKIRQMRGITRAVTGGLMITLLSVTVLAAVAQAKATTSVEGNCLAKSAAETVYPAASIDVSGLVTVTWVDNCTNVDYYVLERSADNGATWTVAATNIAPNTVTPSGGAPEQDMTVTDTPPCSDTGVTYLYRAVAVHKPGNAAAKVSISGNSNSVAAIACGGGGGATGGTCTQLTTAKTIGFWSNKNGQALETAADLTFLNGLNLVDASGTHKTFASKSDLKNWLLSATATNMSYMLSAQLAALELNARHGLVNTASVVCEDTAGRTIGTIMSDANTMLGADGHAVAGDQPNRTDQDAIKTLIDEINNDLVTVQ